MISFLLANLVDAKRYAEYNTNTMRDGGEKMVKDEKAAHLKSPIGRTLAKGSTPIASVPTTAEQQPRMDRKKFGKWNEKDENFKRIENLDRFIEFSILPHSINQYSNSRNKNVEPIFKNQEIFQRSQIFASGSTPIAKFLSVVNCTHTAVSVLLPAMKDTQVRIQWEKFVTVRNFCGLKHWNSTRMRILYDTRNEKWEKFVTKVD